MVLTLALGGKFFRVLAGQGQLPRRGSSAHGAHRAAKNGRVENGPGDRREAAHPCSDYGAKHSVYCAPFASRRQNHFSIYPAAAAEIENQLCPLRWLRSRASSPSIMARRSAWILRYCCMPKRRMMKKSIPARQIMARTTSKIMPQKLR